MAQDARNAQTRKVNRPPGRGGMNAPGGRLESTRITPNRAGVP